MTKDVIHDHNSTAPRLHLSFFFFLLPGSLCIFLSTEGYLDPFFLNMHGYLQKTAQESRQIFPGKLQLAQANLLLTVEGIHLRKRVVARPGKLLAQGLSKIFSTGKLVASLGKFGVIHLCEKTFFPFLLALFLNLTNNHQNLQNHR